MRLFRANDPEVLRLAAETALIPSTVQLFLNGERTKRPRASTRKAITEAAERLGLTHLLPPPPTVPTTKTQTVPTPPEACGKD